MGLRSWLTKKALESAPDHRGLIDAALGPADELEGYVFGELGQTDPADADEPLSESLPTASHDLAIALSRERLTVWDFGPRARNPEAIMVFAVDRFRVRTITRAVRETGGRALITITFSDGSSARYETLQHTVYDDFYEAIKTLAG